MRFLLTAISLLVLPIAALAIDVVVGFGKDKPPF